MPVPAMPSARRLPGLDLLRALAIAWVMLYHAALFDLVPDPDRWYVGRGWMGVDIFFVLSGFLIASQLFGQLRRGDRPDYAKFLVRRAFRTFPAYAAILAVYFLVPPTRELDAIQPLWRFLSFTENIAVDMDRRTFSHVWSLCVEEQFYLLLPLVIVILGRRPTARGVCIALASVALLGMAVRGWLWLARVAATPFDIHAAPDWRPFMRFIYYPTWSRLDGLVAGVAAAALKTFRPRLWQRLTARANTLLLAGLAGVGLSVVLFDDLVAPFLVTVFGFPLLACSIALIVAAATTNGSVIGRHRIPGARALATGSYSLYLSHKIAYHLVAARIVPTFAAAGLPRLAMAIGLAVLFGTLLHWSVERPFLALRDRLDGRSRHLVPPARRPAAGLLR